ncbi:MAG: hypothetical protein QG597_3519, partial [Actinomycetota bacterium]|nr:hypothetical protein [Actinomycetota bacterium]
MIDPTTDPLRPDPRTHARIRADRLAAVAALAEVLPDPTAAEL